ncbi:MAG: FliM/FliN family flagellar motor switch protein [Planctomycetota bacterium]|jgi:flagellar motor switch protein FliN/FliY
MAEATADPQEQVAQEPDTQSVEVSDAELPEATDSGARTDGGQIDILLDAVMQITVQLGDARIEVRELLQLGPGSVVKLDKKAGEPVELYLRGIRFAIAKLVVVGDQLGVRIEEILPAVSEAATGENDSESSETE